MSLSTQAFQVCAGCVTRGIGYRPDVTKHDSLAKAGMCWMMLGRMRWCCWTSSGRARRSLRALRLQEHSWSALRVRAAGVSLPRERSPRSHHVIRAPLIHHTREASW